MKSKITAVPLSLIIILCSCFAAYAAEPVKIAAIFAETGIAGEENKPTIDSLKIAAEQINKDGGVLDRKIKLIVLDNKSTPIGSKIAAQKAVKMGVTAVIGSDWSSHSISMAEVLQKAKIPTISPISSNPKLTKIGDYIFRICFNDNFQGKALADFAYRNLKAGSAIILKNIDEEYSLTLSGLFKDFFIEYGGNILWEGGYRSDTVDFSTLLTEVKKYKPDLIFISGYERDSGLLIKQAVKMGINSTFLGGDTWDTNALYDYAGEALENSYAATHWHPDMSSEYGKIKSLYEKKLGSISKIHSQTVLAYDAITLLMDAIKRAGSAEREKIKKALQETHNFKGITGTIDFDENGDPIDKKVAMLKFENGKWRFVESFPSEEIKIASIFSYTGNAAVHNKPSIEGARFAVEEINESGGILGHKVKLIEIDNKSTPIGSFIATKEAVREDVTAIIGAAWSSHSFEIAKVAQKNKIPMITNISTSPDVTKVGDYIFRACFNDAFQGRVLAEFAKDYLHANSAVILTDLTSKYSVGLADEFEKKFKELGGKTFFQLNYLLEQEEYNEIAVITRNLNPDIIFIPGHDESGLIIKKLLENKVEAILLGGDGWNNENFFKNGGNLLHEGYYCTHWMDSVKTNISKDFIKKYKKYGTVNDKSALAYDAVLLLKRAVEKAGSIDREKIKKALSETKDFEGVTGKISFNEEGDPIKEAVIMKIVNGKPEYLKTVEP